MQGVKNKKLAGWGNYPIEAANIYEPSHIKDMMEGLQSRQEESYIARGVGRSYGDTALNRNRGVILQRPFRQILSFDAQTGIVACEAGVTYEDLLNTFVVQGFFPSVTPGTKYVTIGGAIANDVHGKNHHKDGSISNFVLDFDLLTGLGEVVHCSRTENPELFWATIGGIGLTGIIVKVRIRLIPIESAYMEVHYDKACNLDEAFDHFSAHDADYQYSVAWIDCLATGKALGRSVLMRGNHVPKHALPSTLKAPLVRKEKWKWNIPFYFPGFVLNARSIQLFNQYYYRSFRDKMTRIIDYDRFFYPLDAISNWNRAYGRRGLVQYQVVFPLDTSRAGLVELLSRLSVEKCSSFLAVLKSFGAGNQAPLSFPFRGYTLALDIPLKNPGLFGFLRKLDELVLKHRGRIYLAKDATLAPEHLRQMYPEVDHFLHVKKRVDPAGIFSSSMARRLNINVT
jgi:decaprenylphospho-beta-D-ribofuranose 2-oxidase